MHLLSTIEVRAELDQEAVDLGQTPGDIVVLSAADTELASLAAARTRLPLPLPSLRLANLLQLQHPLSVDLYVEAVIGKGELVVARLLGGRGYWPYGVEQLELACAASGAMLALLPGDEAADADLERRSTLAPEQLRQLHRYLAEGGPANAQAFLSYAASLLGLPISAPALVPLPRAGLYHPQRPGLAVAELESSRSGLALVVFYRALLLAGDLAPVDALLEALAARALEAVGFYAQSLKEPQAARLMAEVLDRRPVAIVLNATGFTVGGVAGEGLDPLRLPDCPVLQVVLGSEGETAWRESLLGLGPRDLAMSVALPEIDGRVLARAISFKSRRRLDEGSELPVVRHEPVPDRVDFTADLARNWVELGRTEASQRRVALILANYPNRDGRLANGVGLDTPESAARILQALAQEGYDISAPPADGAALMARLLAGPTNDPRSWSRHPAPASLGLDLYEEALAALPPVLRESVLERWGKPDQDPRVAHGAFQLPVVPFGKFALGLQPARGYEVDPATSYHDPLLPPPHGYLAFYFWLRRVFGAQAVVQVGKHGNLEWLPGKALALSGSCWPEAVLGPTPLLYPFIVNDPGEGTQAKRRTSAVILDHLTPPLTRAGNHGELEELERLVDELSLAQDLDPRRAKALQAELAMTAERLGLAQDLGLSGVEDQRDWLLTLDRHLCELKELQIRDGLHIFGQAPQGPQRAALLHALQRLAAAPGEPASSASLASALARDLGLSLAGHAAGDPAAAWEGPRPAVLATAAPGAWRTQGDTTERLENLALLLIGGEMLPDVAWHKTRMTLDRLRRELLPTLDRSAEAEMANLLAGLAGKPVPPGPSGAPTRGRLDVLPTGRNFFSVDTRAIPTPTAWQLGCRGAELVLQHYLQQHGEWPRAIAVSAWGTANMRTGGDDIAQVLAFLGCRPVWDATGRVTGVEVLPTAVLGRPRVDVTLRISGFFRDAFPAQVEFLDDAFRAVAALDEPSDVNPLAASAAALARQLGEAGVESGEARRLASLRLFGSAPGFYGTGLQALVDGGGWTDEGELATAFTAWGSYAYGRGVDGRKAEQALLERLRKIELVLHNQDNREHDLLDSDDYWQFAGGLTAAIRAASGRQPAVAHLDSSHPERIRVRRLQEEIGLVVRGRSTNPRWLEGVMRHGYKGAFEIAATVDYLFAFAATTHLVTDQHFELLFDAYLADERVRDFMAEANPAALAETADRFAKAIERGFWRPRRNDALAVLDSLRSP